MSITFGSVGDIITVCLLVKDLVASLDESRGSAAEYQEVRRELRGLERALLEVELLSRSRSSTSKLSALYATARKAALDCRYPVENLLKKIKHYDSSLGEAALRNVVRNTAMKIRWQVSQKDEIAKFRAEISAHSSSINMLLATANVTIAEETQRELRTLLSDAEVKTEAASNRQNTVLLEVRDKLIENNRLLVTGNSITSKLREALNIEWLSNVGAEIKDFMQKIFNANIATYNAVLALQNCVSGGLDRSLIHEPFILEDAIGRIAPVHVQFINSWEAFDAVLNLRFENVQGWNKVRRKEYLLQVHATRREISRTRAWEGAFLPGQRIDMSLIFDSVKGKTAPTRTSCPGCQTKSEETPDNEIQCKTCGIWYQRITEIIDAEPPSPTPTPNLHRPHLIPSQFGRPSFNEISYGPKPPSRFKALESSPKRKLDSTELEEDDPSQFKRIRLVSKETRVKNLPGPFSHHFEISENAMDPTQQQDAEEDKAWSELRTLQNTLGDLHPDTLSCLYSLTRRLRNRTKYSMAEEILRATVDSGAKELLANKPEVLQLLLAGLMAVFVDQRKLDSAEDLWQKWVEIYATKVGEESTQSLIQRFQDVYPLRSLGLAVLQNAVYVDHEMSGEMEMKSNWVESAARFSTRETDEIIKEQDDDLQSSSASSVSEGDVLPESKEEALQQNSTSGTLLYANQGFSPGDSSHTRFPSSRRDVPSASPSGSSTSTASREPSPMRLEEDSLRYNASLSFPNYTTLMESIGPLQLAHLPQNSSARSEIIGAMEGNTVEYSLDIFCLLRTIAKGSFGRVSLVMSNKNRRYYALQILNKAKVIEQRHTKHIKQERDILCEVKHPFIGNFWGSFQDTKNVYLVMEYVEGGKLATLLKRSKQLPNHVAKFYAAEVVLALEYLHSLNIICRNLTTENILIDRHGHVKLCDLTFATKVIGRTSTICGTPEYFAPEIIAGKDYDGAVDCWSLGILIFEILCGHTPFHDPDRMKIYGNVLKGQVQYPAHLHFDAQGLVEQLLVADPSCRLGNLEGGMAEIKEHPWFAEVDCERLMNRDVEAPYVPPIRAPGDSFTYEFYDTEDTQWRNLASSQGEERNDGYGDIFAGF